MKTLRAALYPQVLGALAGWSLLMLLVETFKGSSVGGRACYTDPTCGEIGWIPTATWIVGILVILVIGFAVRSREQGDRSGTTLPDKLVAVVVVLGILVFAGAALTFYQDLRTTP
jgi:hypothetical protein